MTTITTTTPESELVSNIINQVSELSQLQTECFLKGDGGMMQAASNLCCFLNMMIISNLYK